MRGTSIKTLIISAFIPAAFVIMVPAASFAAAPSQFIAKMYSEALGRAPDTGGWQLYTNWFLANGCSQNTLSPIARDFFASAEYAAKGYIPEEAVITLYRAVLSREPDLDGFVHFVRQMRAGRTAGEIAQDMAGSAEFASLISDICSGNGYRQDWGMTQAIDIGFNSWTSAQLQNCLNNNTVCSVPQRVVVYLDRHIIVPEGHTLETAGMPSRFAYARQARIVRNSGEFGHMITLDSGATIRNIWISGQRHLFKSVPDGDGVRANIRSVGSGTVQIQHIRSDFPYQRTHLETSNPFGAGAITIDTNLFVGYTANHTPDGTYTWVSDAISNHHDNATILGNHIVDPTDVGIVIFGNDGRPQTSRAYGNTVIHAGLSAYGSFGFDTIGCGALCPFSGPGIHNNTILAGKTQHSDIMLFLGTAPWIVPNCVTGSACGTGGKVNNNATIWGDENQRIRVQVGILVDGMLQADDIGNDLYINPEPIGACFRGAGIINDLPDHASGNLMLEKTAGAHSCIAH